MNDIDFEQELYKHFGQVKDFTLGMRIGQYFYELGKQRQKEQDENEQADLFTIVALDAAQRAQEQIMKEFPKWKKIKAGERLPCPAYVWTIAYDNYPDCFEGRLMPNIQGVKVGRDTWYLPVEAIHNLPKED